MTRRLASMVIATLSACSPQTLADQYLAEMEAIGNTGSTVILVEEHEAYALVLGGSANDDDAVTVTPYESSGSGWQRHPMGGTSCNSASAMLGFQGGYVYCGMITSDQSDTRVTVAGSDATIVDLPGGNRVWFVYSPEQGDPERGN